MEVVICVLGLYNGSYQEVLEIKAPAMHTDQSTWLLDLTEFFKKRPELRGNNNLVMPVNGDDCRFL